MISAKDFQEALHLECLVDSPRDSWNIRTPDLNRPGMQFCGFYEYFAFERPQVIGKVEMAYLEQLSPEVRRNTLEQYYTYRFPCVIVCRGQVPPKELLEIAEKHQVHLFRTSLVTTKFCSAAINYLNRCLAPHMTRHGVLLDVYGVGVLLSGKSGVGKSEAALELVKRGHQLVADDIVDICRIADDRLIGTCPEKVRHYMEIRGIGIIDVKALYGVGSVSLSKTIDLIIELETWNNQKFYDRIGFEDHTIELMGVQVPYLVMPVKPGRNLAIIVEVAARNLSLKRMGHNAARELSAGIMESIEE
ncbi:MAG: HPr(Ser) kinase/phosphatase [Clostridia bacterium]|nr:HPr(Ser) kinase/phosphatase [Clostridia bacterium]